MAEGPSQDAAILTQLALNFNKGSSKCGWYNEPGFFKPVGVISNLDSQGWACKKMPGANKLVSGRS